MTYRDSASMYRFNGFDGRLERLLCCGALLLEAFADVPGADAPDAPLTFEMTGHSGDRATIPVRAAARTPPPA